MDHVYLCQYRNFLYFLYPFSVESRAAWNTHFSEISYSTSATKARLIVLRFCLTSLLLSVLYDWRSGLFIPIGLLVLLSLFYSIAVW